MRILLVGEYSRLHNSLKKGLEVLGHEVTLVGTGDMFKNYPVDKSIKAKWLSDKPLPLLLRKIYLRIFRKDPAELEIGLHFQKLLPKLKNYEVVQLINSHSIGTFPGFETKLLKKLFSQNGNIFLMACGDDYPVIKHYLEGNERNHILTPYMESNGELKADFALKYMAKPYKKLFDFVYENAKAVIPSDVDYKLPWASWEKTMPVIPNPVLLPQNHSPLNIENRKIKIFLGINRMNYIKKGYRFFEAALSQVSAKYPDLVEIKITESLPFNSYVKELENCDILLDTVYSYDQGYNALEAMARGKVVFTGGETEFLEHYGLSEDEVCVNALPDVGQLVEKLSRLIEDPEKITAIGKSARSFIEREHDYVEVAGAYIKVWERT